MGVKKKVNERFFERWSPDMAYVLGFFFADGTFDINPRGSHYFGFHICDKELLLSIRAVLESEHKVARRTVRVGESPRYRLQIGSKKMCGDLEKLGVSSGKTKRMELPEIPVKYLSHFVRGYFDGDGNVWIGYLNRTRKTPTLVMQATFTSGNGTFLNSLHAVLQAAGLQGGTLYAPVASKRDFCRLSFSTLDALKLGEIMYNKRPKLYLKRKKLRFDKFKKLRVYSVQPRHSDKM